jgi:heme-degrading monooxygenase HmoA
MFIAMNQFQVEPDRASEFEDIWKNRETYLQGLDGFVQFALMKGDDPGDYISHSTWDSREAFLAWAQSDAFRHAHSMKIPDGVVIGHPRARFFESVIVEEGSATPSHA